MSEKERCADIVVEMGLKKEGTWASLDHSRPVFIHHPASLPSCLDFHWTFLAHGFSCYLLKLRKEGKVLSADFKIFVSLICKKTYTDHSFKS